MRRSRLIFFLLAFLLLAPGFASAIQLGEKLHPFKQKDLNGNVIDMSTIIGKKPVMLVFWASWCPNCKSEAPKINQLVEKYKKQGMEFIGVNIGINDSIKRARSFVKKTDMTYPTVFDANNTITQKYMVHGVPTILVADSNGRVQFRNHGAPDITEANFKRLMEKQ